jgi:hypothetical protein
MSAIIMNRTNLSVDAPPAFVFASSPLNAQEAVLRGATSMPGPISIITVNLAESKN